MSAEQPVPEAQQPGIRVLPYHDGDAARWDRFVETTFSGTFLHTRRFLSYHGDRFRDASLLIEDETGKLIGVLPAAAHPKHPGLVVSHPGITFGGLLHAGGLRAERTLQTLLAAAAHWRREGFEVLQYKAVPHIYHQVPNEDDLYALFRLNARRYRCDLSCTVGLECRGPVSKRRLRGQEQARKQGVQIAAEAKFAPEFWPILQRNLAEKHGVMPVHTLSEIQQLHSLFPTTIQFVVGLHQEQVVAGIVLFVTPRVVHVQYAASSSSGAKTHALDAVFEYSINHAKELSARYFDFGISSEDEGQYLNSGLHQYKAEFGGGGVVHEFFEFDLR